MGGGETFCRDVRSNSPRGNGRESEDHDSPPLFFGLVSAPLISLLFKTRIRSPSPVTRNRDGISFDDSRAPGLLSFRISSAAFLFFLDLHVPSSVIEISSIFTSFDFFPISNPNNSRVEKFESNSGTRFQGRSGTRSREERRRARPSGVENGGKNARKRG